MTSFEGKRAVLTEAQSPLDHVKVLDLSRAVSGPFAGRILSDLGADVVKVEPPTGDMTDQFGSMQAGRSGLFAQMNAGKRNIQLDLQDPVGADCARRLAMAADVVVENYRPGVLDRLGLGYGDLQPGNPGLVMLSISGFGQRSPEAERRAFAPIVHAESGALIRQARSDNREPTDYTLALADTLAGLHGVVAILAALALRDRTGAGQHIDLSMLEAMLASADYIHEVFDGKEGIGNRGTVWEAVGGPILLAADARSAWKTLQGSGRLADGMAKTDPLPQKMAVRRALISKWIMSFPSRPALLAGLDEAGIAWAELRAPEDLLAEPSLAANPPWDEVDDGGGGTRRVVRMPYRFSAACAGVAGRVAGPGMDRESVLRDWLPEKETD